MKLPFPPLEMRQLVGQTDEGGFDNPSGKLVFPEIPVECYTDVFDFGCGCGRLARQLIQQTPRPSRYLGIDLHKGMIEWCQRNLSPQAPTFRFSHHDVHNLGLNPGKDRAKALPFDVPDKSFTLVVAWSVFTHLLESQTVHYINEVARILRTDGIFLSTWFTFDKQDFPMMQEFQNALYINEFDPTNAVIFDRRWLRRVIIEAGLVPTSITPPTVRGFQWVLQIRPQKPGVVAVDFPTDLAPVGIVRSPLMPPNAESIGL
jgi:SAM-dependent methyltransferase